MKKFRKIMAVLVAAMMIMAMCVPAWAAGDAPGVHTLSYEGNGDGSGTDTSVSEAQTSTAANEYVITINGTASRAADDEGHKFVHLGWTEVPDTHVYSAGDTLDTTRVYKAGDTITLSSSRALYAVWGYNLNDVSAADLNETSPTHTVSYDGNGAQLETIPTTVKVPSGNYTLSKRQPMKPGYAFLGWTIEDKNDALPATTDPAHDVSAGIIQDNDGSKTYPITDGDTDVVFHAWWAVDSNVNGTADFLETQYSVKYNLNATASKDDIIRTIEQDDSTTPVNNAYMGLNLATVNNIVSPYTIQLADLTTPAGVKVHYEKSGETANVAFMGWTTVKDESYTIYDDVSDAANRVTSPYTVTGADTNLWALWGYDRDKNGIADALEDSAYPQATSNSIIIDGAITGETYTAYKMLDLVANSTGADNPTAYAYTVNPKWEEFFSDANRDAWNKVLERSSDNAKYMMRYHAGQADEIQDEADWVYGKEVAKMAELAAKYAATHNEVTPAVNPVQATGDTATITLSESGYYLVTSTLGTRAMIDTVPGTVRRIEKNDRNSVEKTVKEGNGWLEENDCQIGDTVEFKIEATLVPRTRNVSIVDALDDGLTLDETSIKLYKDLGKTLLFTEYELASHSAHGFTINIPDTVTASTNSDEKIFVFYEAKLNKNAIVNNDVDDQTNTVTLKFGANDKEEDSTQTHTRKFDVHKYASGDSITPLGDAVFQLKRDGIIINLMKLDNQTYRAIDSTETTTPVSHTNGSGGLTTRTAEIITSDFVTVGSGDITILGLDSTDTYYLNEIQAPNGYFKLAEEANVTGYVKADNTGVALIENNTGSRLPSTGGMGTTVLYIVGGMLVILAGAYLFFSRKRTA